MNHNTSHHHNVTMIWHALNILDFEGGEYFVAREGLNDLAEGGSSPKRLLPTLALDYPESLAGIVAAFAPEASPTRWPTAQEAAAVVFGAAAVGMPIARESLIEVARRVSPDALASFAALGRATLHTQAGVTGRFPHKLLRMRSGHTVKFWRDTRDAVRLEVEVPKKLFEGITPNRSMVLAVA